MAEEKNEKLKPWQVEAAKELYEDELAEEFETEDPVCDLWDENDPLTKKLIAELERREEARGKKYRDNEDEEAEEAEGEEEG